MLIFNSKTITSNQLLNNRFKLKIPGPTQMQTGDFRIHFFLVFNPLMSDRLSAIHDADRIHSCI